MERSEVVHFLLILNLGLRWISPVQPTKVNFTYEFNLPQKYFDVLSVTFTFENLQVTLSSGVETSRHTQRC